MTIGVLVTIAVNARSDSPLDISISVEMGKQVKVEVRNASSSTVEGDVYPSLVLSTDSNEAVSDGNYKSFWAPVDLITGGPYGANQPRHLALRLEGHLSVLVDPNALLWGGSISSQWPNLPLMKIVPSGRYCLRLDIQGPGESDRSASDCLQVTVEKGSISYKYEEQW